MTVFIKFRYFLKYGFPMRKEHILERTCVFITSGALYAPHATNKQKKQKSSYDRMSPSSQIMKKKKNRLPPSVSRIDMTASPHGGDSGPVLTTSVSEPPGPK